jgi:antitoxin VapB
VNAERYVKLFRNGRNQAVRIPREFELPGEDAVMRKEGDRLVIELKSKPTLADVIDWLRKQPPLGPNDEFPDVADLPLMPTDDFGNEIY